MHVGPLRTQRACTAAAAAGLATCTSRQSNSRPAQQLPTEQQQQRLQRNEQATREMLRRAAGGVTRQVVAVKVQPEQTGHAHPGRRQCACVGAHTYLDIELLYSLIRQQRGGSISDLFWQCL